MANLPIMIVADVAGLKEGQLQTISQKLEKSQKENEMLNLENEALKLVNEQQATQLDEKNKLLVTKDEDAQQLRRELQVSKAGRVQAKRQQAEFNAFSWLSPVCILYFLVNCNRL